MAGDRVAVWWLAADGVEAGQWAALAAGLSASERERAARFHFERDRHSYVAAHALGRALLAAWTGIAGPRWCFHTGAHGKPEVASPDWPRRLRLNLSHTRGLAAAVLTEETDVGIDVEWLDRQAAADAVAERFFAASECALLRAAPPTARVPTFLSLWTLKEAYVKAIGKGLAQPLDAFAFTLEPPLIRFSDPRADRPQDWCFRQWRPTPAHLAAVALRRGGAQEPDWHFAAISAGQVLTGDRVAMGLDFAGGSRES